MTVTAEAVAAALRERLPGVAVKKLHKLLYYCQAHHLAMTGLPMFADTVSAWDMGPVVGGLWYRERTHTAATTIAAVWDEARLNTVGYVVSRYGGLTGRDLELLTHAEEPWLRADQQREPGGRVRIEHAWMKSYFANEVADHEGEVVLDPGEVDGWLKDASRRRQDDLHADHYSELRRRVHAS